jgi:hypothetical protein
MTYPSAIITTSFNIFIKNGGKNITSWNVQGVNNPGGSEFTTLIASTVGTTMQLIANNYYSFNIDNTTAYKIYRFNILGRSAAAAADVGISLLQFNTSTINSNGFTPMAANLNMGRHRVTNVLDPSSGSDAVTRGFLERFVKILDNLPVAELLSQIGDKLLDMRGNKIKNPGTPTATNDAASKGYADTSIANAVSGITAGGPTGGAGSPASREDTLSKSTADSTYLKLDGSSAMGGGLNMGRFAINHLREPSTGSDAATKGYIDRSVVPLVSTVTELSNNS